MIALPTFSPFAFLGAALVRNGWITLVVALMVVGGWARVVYIDTRPYEGGGATFSFLLGWAACTLAFLMAVLLAIAWDARRRSTYPRARSRSEEHTSELPSLMRRQYSVFCLKQIK